MADKPNYITLAHLRTAISALLNKIDTKPDEEDFANVAFSGDYSDLTNRPDLSAYVNWITYSELADYASSVASVNGILKGHGNGSITAAAAGTDYQAPLPSSSGNSGRFLTTDNNGNLSWATNASDDKTWNGVTLNKNATNRGEIYVPGVEGVNNIYAYYNKATHTPTNYAIAKYDANAYLNSTTPGASDNSTKVATTAFVKSKVESLGTVLNYKGTKATAAALPSSGNTAGDVWIVTADNSEHVWNGSAWEEFGPTIDLSGYMEKGIDYVTAGAGPDNISLLGTKATAEGVSTLATGDYSHSEGYGTKAIGEEAHAEGAGSYAFGPGSHAEGQSTKAIGDYSHSEGTGFITGDSFAISGSTDGVIYTYPSTYSFLTEYDLKDNILVITIGGKEIIRPIYSADTTNSQITLYDPINEDTVSTLSSQSCTIIRTNAKGNNSHTEGIENTASGIASHAEGISTIVKGDYSHAEGGQTIVSSDLAHAEGFATRAESDSSHAEGSETQTKGDSAHAEGHQTIAEGNSAHAEGTQTTASGDYSHAEGFVGFALGQSSHIEGQGTASKNIFVTRTITGAANTTVYSVSEANDFSILGIIKNDDENKCAYITDIDYQNDQITLSAAISTVAFTDKEVSYLPSSATKYDGPMYSRNTGPKVAMGGVSHAEGLTTMALGTASHAEGRITTAIGIGAHSEGAMTTAVGSCSHAEGFLTTANGGSSHAEGFGTIANGDYQHTFGEYNIFDDVKYSRYGIPKGRMRGDMNGDGIIDGADAVVMNNYYRNIDRDIDSIAIWCGDIIVNSAINVTDYTALLQYLAGNSTPLTSTPTFADYYNNWTYVKVDDLIGYWTYNVTISSADATNLVDVYAANLVSYSLSGTTLTINVSRPPITDSSILIDVGSGNGSYSKHIEIVGGGKTSTYLSNARTLDWLGNETLAGKLTLGAGPENSMDATTKQYVDTAIGNAASITMIDHSTNTTTELNNLTINKLSQAQYQAISNPDPNQLYMITDDTIYATKTYVDNLITNIDALPSQSGNSGKYLTTNGTTASWATINALPAQSGNSGKFLTTNGTTASWTTKPSYTYSEVGAAANSHNHSASDITSGTLAIARGGTNATTAADARANLGTLGSKLANSYEGITNMAGADNVWIRTTSQGIIPYQSGAAGSGHCSIGTSSWYFSAMYADNFYGKLNGNCTGSSASCTGNAATVSRATFGDSSNGTHDANAMTSNGLYYYTSNGPATSIGAGSTDGAIYCQAYNTSWVGQIAQDYRDGDLFIRGKNSGTWQSWKRVWVTGDSVTGAVWNDYAEYRETDVEEFGRCVIENGDDTMSLSTKRLQKGCSITSDTWGFAQGKTEKAKTPIAVSGRVLAYPFEDKEEFRKHIGDAVCSGPEGTVSIMTDEEIQKYPLSIIGTISAVPDYEEWGGGSDRDPVKVNGRVWIRIK